MTPIFVEIKKWLAGISCQPVAFAPFAASGVLEHETSKLVTDSTSQPISENIPFSFKVGQVEEIKLAVSKTLAEFVCLLYVVQDTVTAGATVATESIRPLILPIYGFLWVHSMHRIYLLSKKTSKFSWFDTFF